MLERIFTKLEEYADKLPEPKIACSGDMLCERTQGRHKAGCIGKTIAIRNYMKSL